MAEQPVAAHDDADLGDDEFDGSDDDPAATGTAAGQASIPAPAAAGSTWGGPAPAEGREVWDSPSMYTGSGWVHADYTATSYIFAAAHSEAQYGGPPVQRLNCAWDRPDDHDVQPLGHNARGDIAPPQVHVGLSYMLRSAGETSTLVQKLAHGLADKIWLLHSRSHRLDKAVASGFDFLPESSRTWLVELMQMHPLTDMRLVAATVDPREKPVYGVTLDSAGRPRWREIFMPRTNNPGWDSDPGGISGSSPEESGVHRQSAQYQPLSPSDEERQVRRWADRRTRRLARSAQLAADRANQAQVALEELLARQSRAETLHEILLRGVAAERGLLPLTEAQQGRAWYEHRRPEPAVELMPATP